MPASRKRRESVSEVSTATVPMSTGWPRRWRSVTSAMIAANFSRCVRYIWSFSSTRRIGRFVGMTTTSRR